MILKTVFYRLRHGLALGLIASFLFNPFSPVVARAADRSVQPRLPAGAPPFLQSFGFKTPAQINTFLRVATRAKLEPRADLTPAQVRKAMAAYADDLVGRAGVSQTAEIGELAILRAELRDSGIISMIAPEKRVVLSYSRRAVAGVIKDREAALGRKIEDVGQDWDDKKSDAVSAPESSPSALPAEWRLAKASPRRTPQAADKQISIQSVKRLLRIELELEPAVLAALDPKNHAAENPVPAKSLEDLLRELSGNISPETIIALGTAYAGAIEQGQNVSIAPLEVRSGSRWPPEIRMAAATALGMVYAAKIARGDDGAIDPLEELLKAPDEDIRLNAAAALGAVYAARIRQGRNISIAPLEASLKGPWGARGPAAAVLGGVYAAMIGKGQDISAAPLEALLFDEDDDARHAAITSLGAVYAAKILQGQKISIRPLEALLDSSGYVRHFVVPALGTIYAAMARKEEFFIRPAEQTKYDIWRNHNLPFEEEIVDRYLAAADGAVFLQDLEAQAVKLIEEGFDPANEEQRWLAFLGIRMRGLEMRQKQFEARLTELVRFEKNHPGYLKALFSKTRGLPALSVSGQTDGYRLEPQGFLSAFHGDSLKALHEDTIFYGVYKGRKLAGFVGMLVGRTKDGRKVLAVDAINSPSWDGEMFLGNLLQELSALAKRLGYAGVGLPRNIGPEFNFKNSHAVKTMPIYKTAKAIRITPVHAESWTYFADKDAEGVSDRIEDGRFKLVQAIP